ncbi:anthranilate synthase component I family protein [Persephonella sp.]
MEVYLYSEKDGWFEDNGIFLFHRPVLRLVYNRGLLFINHRRIKTEKPFLFIEKLVKEGKYYCTGYISYDYGKRKILRKYIPQKDDLNLPEIYCLFFKKFEKIDNLPQSANNQIKKVTYRTEKKHYLNKILEAKYLISKGDIYQVNLAHRIDVEGFFHPETVFSDLIHYQPTPYLMLLKDPSFSIISASMELFLKKEGKTILTKPIKGTRKRGISNEEDKKLRSELEKSEKERAENLMITDLMRNDLGKISEKGSVKVEKLFCIENYRSVFQMVSTVSSKLKDSISLQAIIDHTFPPGSVTGAPKIRAMEIIAELEDLSRSVYCGATFLIKPDLDFVMSVAIRQSIFKKNRCSIYVGSGIVADSDPEMEYEETIIKLKANIESLFRSANR